MQRLCKTSVAIAMSASYVHSVLVLIAISVTTS